MPDTDKVTYLLVQGSQWLREWEVPVSMAKPFLLQQYVRRDWETGRVTHQHDLGDYEATWGSDHYMVHRQDIHGCLLHTATSKEGKGTPCKLIVDHM
jgi:salicylate hydroxylase